MSDIRNLDGRLLLAFAAIFEARSVSRAAERLNITQQGLSGVLVRLRHLFNDPLFVREAHGVVPTPRAETLYSKVKAAIDTMEDVLEVDGFNPSEAQAIFRVAAADYALTAVLPPLVQGLKKSAPNLKLAIETFRIEALALQMRNGQIDLALTVPEFVPDALHATTLFSDRYLCAYRKQHPLAGGKLTLDAFCSAEHLLVSPNRGEFRGPTDDALERVGRERTVGLVVPSFLIALALLEDNDLVAMVPERLLRQRQQHFHIVEPPLEIDPFDIVCVWPERLHTDPLNVWFREQLHAQASNL